MKTILAIIFFCSIACAQDFATNSSMIPPAITPTVHTLHAPVCFVCSDADPTVAFCRAYWGSQSGAYSNTITLTNIPGTTNFQGQTATAFVVGTTNYAAATAVGTNGLESEFSSELSWVVTSAYSTHTNTLITFSLPQNLFTLTLTNPVNPFVALWEDSNFNVRISGLGPGEQSVVLTNVGQWAGPMQATMVQR